VRGGDRRVRRLVGAPLRAIFWIRLGSLQTDGANESETTNRGNRSRGERAIA